MKILKFLLVCGVGVLMWHTSSAKICYIADVECIESVKRIYSAPDVSEAEPDRQIEEEDEGCEGYDLAAPLSGNYICSVCINRSGEHYQCQECNAACQKLSPDCKEFMYKYRSVAYTPITPGECETIKDSLGMKRCVTSGYDYLAGAAKVCGGLNNLVTEDTKLAQCMYGKTSGTSVYGTRKDMFLKSYGADTRDHVFVWVAYEGGNADNRGAIVRMFDYSGSIPYYAERGGARYYTGTGTSPTSWQNKSILSQTLCRVR